MASATAAAAAARGTQTFIPMLRKGYHRKSGSPEMVSDKVKLNGEEIDYKRAGGVAGGNGSDTNTWWIRDDRTGIYYPKGQEKVLEDIPQGAAKNFGKINWFD